MRRRVTTAIAIGLIVALGLAVPAVAQTSGGGSRTFVVNTTADTTDASPNGQCRDANGQCSLRAAVQEANGLGGSTTIQLSATTYALTIRGAGNASATSGDLDVYANIRLDGRGATIDLGALGDRAFDMASGAQLTATQVTVTGGRPPRTESGGAFRSSSNLTLDRVTATNGSGRWRHRGGLYNDGGTLRVFQTDVNANTATTGSGSGGGILNNGGGLTVTDSRVFDNSSARAGGAIETVGGTVNLNRAALWTNTTGPRPGNGGGLHAGGAATVNVRNLSVVGNTAANEGGGLWNSGVGTMTVDQTDIVNNTANRATADSGGGGIYNEANDAGNGGGTLNITRSTLAGNRATTGSGSGGGILNNLGTLTISDSTIGSNQSARAGGGVEVRGGENARVGRTQLDDVRLTNNRTGSAPGNGGGLHLGGNGVVVIDDSRVTGNSAANEGGGLWNSPSGQMTVTDTPIVNNTAGTTGPNVYQEEPLAGGRFTVDGTVIPPGPNNLSFP